MTNDLLEVFGEPISVYSDTQALDDRVLVDVRGLFPAAWKLNRATRAVWDVYTAPMDRRGLVTDVTGFVRAVTVAWESAQERDGWRIGQTPDGRTLWFVPNEVDGFTAMFPDDY